MLWYQKTAHFVLSEFGVNVRTGLTLNQVQLNFAKFGPNKLASAKKEKVISIFIRQFKSPLIYVLFLAAVLVFLTGQRGDAIVILFVVSINAFIGTFMEGKARDSLKRLSDLTIKKALVRRESEEMIIPTAEIVPGDILVLREGDKVPADARIISCESLTVDESLLTGEAFPVPKKPEALTKEGLVVGDQINMVFSGTSVSSGYCEAVVVATGLSSQLGRISSGLAITTNVPLPLFRKINRLTKILAVVVLVVAVLIFGLGIIRGIAVREIFLAVVGLSVSIIPEGLPVVLTIVLAGGVWRMAKNKAVVRQMAAVEAMGNADVLLVDKTGTITTGEMIIKEIHLNRTQFEVSGDGYESSGEVSGGNEKSQNMLKKIMSLAFISLKADTIMENGVFRPVGDPTEAAIAVVCKKMGLSKEQLLNRFKIVDSKPFDSTKRYLMSAFKDGKDVWFVYIGAPEFLASSLRLGDQIDQDYRKLASEGKRVVGIAVYGPNKGKLFGWALMSISEEIRPNVAQSVFDAKQAGLKIAILTGDYPQTAKAIAEKVGIFEKGDRILTGSEIEQMNDAQLRECIGRVTVFSRITPMHKLKIVQAFKQSKHIVAMTGDGVNDGPALQAANLGIGLGGGTQVAQDASDIVLLDDNFSTIVGAIYEGRGIYLTLKKVILYLFSTSFGEVFVIGGSVLLGLPLPIAAVQIIWLNFVTDGFLDVSLAQDPAGQSETRVVGRNSGQLVDKSMLFRMVIVGVSMLVCALPVFVYLLNNKDIATARSMALLVLSMSQWLNALNVRSETESVFKISLLNNRFLLAAFVIVFGLQIFAIQSPWGNSFLHTTPLAIEYWLGALLISSVVVWTEEIRKFFARRTDLK